MKYSPEDVAIIPNPITGKYDVSLIYPLVPGNSEQVKVKEHVPAHEQNGADIRVHILKAYTPGSVQYPSRSMNFSPS